MRKIYKDKKNPKLSEIKELMNLFSLYENDYKSEEYRFLERDIYKSIIKQDSKYVDNLLRYNNFISFSRQ